MEGKLILCGSLMNVRSNMILAAILISFASGCTRSQSFMVRTRLLLFIELLKAYDNATTHTEGVRLIVAHIADVAKARGGWAVGDSKHQANLSPLYLGGI
jgi:hypothetical protein